MFGSIFSLRGPELVTEAVLSEEPVLDAARVAIYAPSKRDPRTHPAMPRVDQTSGWVREPNQVVRKQPTELCGYRGLLGPKRTND